MNGWPIWMGLWCSAACWRRSRCAARGAGGDEDALTGAVAAFEAALFARGTNWTEALLDAVLEEEKPLPACGSRAGCRARAGDCAEQRAGLLQTLGRAPLDEVFPGAAVFLPRWGDNARRRLPRGL